MSSNDPVAWANKRKAAIENAKKLREARKNGDTEEAPSFTPQVNKRPSYLKQTDSLDKLTGATSADPNDIFEQPLPGARAAQPAHVEYSKQNLPSPGSDALGREVKRFGQDDNKSNAPAYKSKFLQQYEQDNSQQDDYEVPSRSQPQVARNNYPAQNKGYEYSSPVRAEEPDEPFMNSLRGAGGSTGKKAPQRSAGPGWNDDTTSGGFPAPVPVRKNSASKVRSKPSYENEYDEAPPTRVPVGGRRAQTQQKQPKGDWNMDTDVAYDAPPAALPPKVSPRLPAQQARAGRGDTDGAASQARPNLSLLKSKIRRSESGKNVLAMESHSSSAAFNGQSERDYGATTSEKVADIRNGGRRSAPNPSLPSESASAGRAPANRLSRTTQGQYRNGNSNGNGNGYEEQEEEQAYVPSQIAGRSKARPAAQPAPAQRPAFSAQYDEDDDDPYGPDAYPPGQRAPARSQPAPQQPKFKPQPQARNSADSRFDDDPYGPDAYPPGGYPPSQQQPKPAVQKRAPADSRFDDDPYGPDAYPPGGYPPAQQSKAKPQPVAQARRPAADSRFDEDPYGADAYPPARSQPAAQSKPKAQPAPQRRAAAPEPRYDDDPYGPDAYPPGGYPPAAASAPSEYPEESGETRECPHCSRNFNVGPFAKHIKICEKVFMKKRKVFDSTKMRLEGVDPELDKILAKAAKDAAKQAALDKRNAAKTGNNQAFPGNKPQAAAAPSRGGGGGGGGGGGDDGGAATAAKAAKWKEDSNAFRNAMKAARQYTKAVAEGKPLPPPVASAPDASLILCNNCGRRFNQKAAERHIPQCKNIIAKPTALKRGAGGGGGVNGTAAVQAGSLGSTKGKGRF